MAWNLGRKTKNVAGDTWEGGADFWGDATEWVTGNKAGRDARDAALAQEEMGREGLNVQKEMYDQNRQDMMPWLQAGERSLGTLEGMMDSGEFEMAPEEFQMQDFQGQGDFSFTPQDYEESPYAKFLQAEGQRGIQRSAAARGGLASGATLGALQKRSMGIASGDYENQYNRKRGEHTDRYNRDYGEYADKQSRDYQNFIGSYGRRAGQNADKYNRLGSMAGVGQTQSSRLGEMGGQFGRSYNEGLTGIGNVRGAGIIGQNNARQQGTQNVLNLIGQGIGYAGTRK